MTNKTELLPCPFCGGKAEIDTLQCYRNIVTGALETAVSVYCASCDANCTSCRGDHPDLDPQVVIDRWNTRAAPAEDVRLHQSAADTLKQAADTLDAIDRRRIERAERLGLTDDVRAVVDEPVAVVVLENFNDRRASFLRPESISEGTKLYLHPQRRLEMADVVKAHMEIPYCPVLTSNQCHALAMKLNACLDRIAEKNK